MPAARVWNDSTKWSIGEPDLVVRTEEVTVKAGAPDWWGEIPPTPTGLTEDRYVSAVEVREVNDIDSSGTGRETVGGALRLPPHDLADPAARRRTARRPIPPTRSTWPR